MNNEADYSGRRKGRTANSILTDGGTGFDRSNATGRDRDGVPLHRGRTNLKSKDGCVAGLTPGPAKLVCDSPAAPGNHSGSGASASVAEMAVNVARIPESVRASVGSRVGEYDARRLRSQREIIRDVMISAADCETWLTLEELRALTCYGEASISAQLRHLRKTENGGYEVVKRQREGVRIGGRPGTDGRGECVWEYRITREMCVDRAGSGARLVEMSA